MAKKLYEESDVQAVAAAIRLKNGGSTSYKLSEMALAIEGLKTGENFVQTEVPDYVKAAALEVAKKVKAVQTTDSITFIAASDAHQLDADEYIVSGNKHAFIGRKALGYILPNIDFCGFLGDYTVDTGTTALAEGRQHFAEINAGLKEGFADIPQFRTPGEFDGLKSSWRHNGGSLTSEEIYSYVGKYNEGATYGSTTEGYCYRDFDEKKLRVFCLNTSIGGENLDVLGRGHSFALSAGFHRQRAFRCGKRDRLAALSICHGRLVQCRRHDDILQKLQQGEDIWRFPRPYAQLQGCKNKLCSGFRKYGV